MTTSSHQATPTTKVYDKTIFEVSLGSNVSDTEMRYFGPTELPDAAVAFSEAVVFMDAIDEYQSAWVALKRLPDSIYPEGVHILHWTKVSNERPHSLGALSPDDI